MTCFQLIFSPTGGTERVAKALTETWPEVQTIDLSAQNFTAPAIPFSADDLVLIAMPAFEAMAPQPALDRLALLQGNGARCALAAVYGNRAVDNTLARWKTMPGTPGSSPLPQFLPLRHTVCCPNLPPAVQTMPIASSWPLSASRSSKNSLPAPIPARQFPESITAKRSGPG